MGVIASIQGRCPYDIVLDRFALSDGKAVFYSERTDELFSALSRANEVTIHNLKPLFLAAVGTGSTSPCLFRYHARRLPD